MGIAGWWHQRRYGLFVHANIATVPAFSPVHEYAEWYWSHWAADPLPDVLLHPRSPLPEVAAHHAARHPGITSYDQFLDDLTFERFDAGALADLAVAAGMGYLVHVTKHHDGFCWWDSAAGGRTSVHAGPRRDVLAEVAAATRRAGLVFGTYYSLLDWAHPAYPDPYAYVEAYLHRQVLELVERYGSEILWGDGHWGHGGDHWRSDELVERARRAAAAAGHELVVNDRWFTTRPDVRTYEYDTPPGILDEPWELCRGLAYSFGCNQAERAEHHLSPAGLVALLTEVVAKGGNLLLNVGLQADGSVPEIQQRILLAAGAWVRANGATVAARPFDCWGDDSCRYLRDGAGVVHAVDVANRALAAFPALGRDRAEVLGVRGPDGRPVAHRQDEHALVVERPPLLATSLAPVYRVDVQPRPSRVAVRHEPPVPLAPLLDAIPPGGVLELAPGRYAGPVTVAEWRTLRGLHADQVVLDGGGRTAVTLAQGTLDAVTVVNGPPDLFAWPGATVVGGHGSHVRGCTVEGGIVIAGDAVAHLLGNRVRRGGLRLLGCVNANVADNHVDTLRWAAGIEVAGGTSHRVEGNQVQGGLCGIRIREASASVDRNVVAARWWGIHLDGCTETRVRDNVVTDSMRAFCVTGGHDVVLRHNLAESCDTGVLVEAGAEATIGRHQAVRCRVGALVWDSPATRLKPSCSLEGSLDHDLVTGP